jgi:hypothetical protein
MSFVLLQRRVIKFDAKHCWDGLTYHPFPTSILHGFIHWPNLLLYHFLKYTPYIISWYGLVPVYFTCLIYGSGALELVATCVTLTFHVFEGFSQFVCKYLNKRGSIMQFGCMLTLLYKCYSPALKYESSGELVCAVAAGNLCRTVATGK